jgi:hypothetical protein
MTHDPASVGRFRGTSLAWGTVVLTEDNSPQRQKTAFYLERRFPPSGQAAQQGRGAAIAADKASDRQMRTGFFRISEQFYTYADARVGGISPSVALYCVPSSYPVGLGPASAENPHRMVPGPHLKVTFSRRLGVPSV